ncbi:CsiV family protein [Neptuniibacter sp.]|uniref:CsiV family protein n=1 Tax=Neptuniibacter sp. TaxID=1962643 RepID=UPI00262BAB25|nr:CsiV family protein [Neptuniibacter sp.]MCP4597909.1 hypothetical protein [Neptuniibacter sp.]
MKKWFRIALIPTLLALSSIGQANEWYTVEVIIFANNDSSVIADEYWPEIDEIPAKSAIRLKPVNEGEIDSFQKLPKNLLSLHDEKNRIRSSGKYRVLYHQGWMQPVAETQRPKPIRITAGDIMDNGMYELDGYIAVGRGRYLHFRPDLYFSRRLTADETSLLKKKAATKTETAMSEPVQAEAMPTTQTASGAVSTLPQNTMDLFIPEILTVNQTQARRMRSKELHYIDHPLFGIMVEIKPVN